MYKAYTDGAFKNNITGYGVVIVNENNVIATFGGTVKNSEMWQIEGELTAIMEAVRYCEKGKIELIEINYDYTGCKEFALNNWKSKKDFIIKYKIFMAQTKVKMLWNKVKSHSNNLFNDMADQLAKNSIEKEEYLTSKL